MDAWGSDKHLLWLGLLHSDDKIRSPVAFLHRLDDCNVIEDRKFAQVRNLNA